MIIQCIVLTMLGFISGSIMYSYFIPKLAAQVDVIKSSEDGNPGSSNAIKAGGLPLGLLCMLLDVLKAFIPVFVAVYLFNLKDGYIIPVLVAPVLGHAFSPFLGLRGGKAVSVTFGSLLGIITISRIVFLFAVVLAFFSFILVICPNSTRIIVGSGIAFAFSLLLEPMLFIKIAYAGIMLIVLYKHYKNPDIGENTISFWHYTLDFKENHMHINKTA
jgi:glycerol-3-phosphate acyltransferase PlsY